MRYKAVFKVAPPSFFGLPEEGKTVVPAAENKELLGPTLDSRSGKLVQHGTLSDYRPEDHKVDISEEMYGARLNVTDNFFSVQVEANEINSAVHRSLQAVERLLRHLMIEQGEYMKYELLQIEELESPNRVVADPLPQAINLGAFTVYNVTELQSKIQRSAARTFVNDDRLERALVYYEHGRLMYNLRGHLQPLSGHHSLMVTSSYLNLWKALTTVLGDPSTDSDYQSRFRDFGFPKGFWEATIRPLKDIRDSSDVAHYSMDPDAIGEVERAFGKIDKVCRKVIAQYADHLLSAIRPRP